MNITLILRGSFETFMIWLSNITFLLVHSVYYFNPIDSFWPHIRQWTVTPFLTFRCRCFYCQIFRLRGRNDTRDSARDNVRVHPRFWPHVSCTTPRVSPVEYERVRNHVTFQTIPSRRTSRCCDYFQSSNGFPNRCFPRPLCRAAVTITVCWSIRDRQGQVCLLKRNKWIINIFTSNI